MQKLNGGIRDEPLRDVQMVHLGMKTGVPRVKVASPDMIGAASCILMRNELPHRREQIRKMCTTTNGAQPINDGREVLKLLPGRILKALGPSKNHREASSDISC